MWDTHGVSTWHRQGLYLIPHSKWDRMDAQDMWGMRYTMESMDGPLISHGTVGYDGKVEWEWDSSPTTHSIVRHVGLKHTTVQWMATHIPHGTQNTRGNVVDSPT